MNIRINAICGCGFRIGTDGTNEVPEAEVTRLIGLFEKNRLEGIPLVVEAAGNHCTTRHHTLELHIEFRAVRPKEVAA